jgi:1,4-dihydroxy-2-naphthoate polyprenyltransferase
VVALASIGGVIAMFYTAPPVSLNFRGYGELALFLAFGPLAVAGVYFVLTGTLSWEPVVVSIPLGIFTMNIGSISAMFDYHSDIGFPKKVMTVRFGRERTYKLLGVLFALAYAPIALGVMVGMLPAMCLLGLLTIPLAAAVMVALRRYDDTSKYARTMGMAIGLPTLTGLLLCLAYVLA